jgi:putative copper export protein
LLAPALDALRLSLHVLAAAVWVGGQIVMVGLVGPARSISPAAPKTLARAFARVSWPAYGVLLLTGIWNVTAVHPANKTTAFRVVLGVKIAVALLAGVAAFAHGRATSRQGLAIWGSASGILSVAALVLGVVLAG